MTGPENKNDDLQVIRQRVNEKLDNYLRYDFNQSQNNLLKCFFDLAQEFDSLHDLYRVCVTVPYESLGLESSLYLLDDEEKHLQFVCGSREGVVPAGRAVPTGIHLAAEPYTTNDSYLVPIYRKHPSPPGAEKPETISLDEPTEDQGWQRKSRIMGMLEVYPLARIPETDRFFLVKYANRIGYSLHNRQIARQNIRHLRFINSLVMDIEHNVIVPNMYFRYLFNQLKKKIIEMESLEVQMKDMAASHEVNEHDCMSVIDSITALRNDLLGYQQEMLKHHANVSLFLESLFRREHFQRGHLVLQPKRCLVEKDIIKPQLENYETRLKNGKVTIDRPATMAEEEFPLMVDVGLLAQVYANLFSNAVKYTETVTDHQGRTRKALAYGREIINDFFGPGQDGIKFNVFTTGPHLPEAEGHILFTDGTRGSNSLAKQGTGHGLSFIKHVIEMHGGQVGYEPTSQGNNFFFIPPLPTTKAFSRLTDTGRQG